MGKNYRKNVIGTLSRADNGIAAKEQQAIRFLKTMAKRYPKLWVAYSGGKDSEVLLSLVERAGIPYRAFYNSTTIDPPGTLAHVKKHPQVIIRRPKRSFLELIRHRGLPSPFQRFCCDKLKEQYFTDIIVTGVRQAESSNRKRKNQEPEKCHIYKNGKRGIDIMPLLYWSNQDIENYIKKYKLKCHPKYYDNEGIFHIERRVGCLACPLRGDRGIFDFIKYPKLLKAEIKALAEYRNTRTVLGSSITTFRDEYENMYHNLFHQRKSQLIEKQAKRERYFAWHELEYHFKIELPEPTSKLEDLIKKIPVKDNIILPIMNT